MNWIDYEKEKPGEEYEYSDFALIIDGADILDVLDDNPKLYTEVAIGLNDPMWKREIKYWLALPEYPE